MARRAGHAKQSLLPARTARTPARTYAPCRSGGHRQIEARQSGPAAVRHNPIALGAASYSRTCSCRRVASPCMWSLVWAHNSVRWAIWASQARFSRSKSSLAADAHACTHGTYHLNNMHSTASRHVRGAAGHSLGALTSRSRTSLRRSRCTCRCMFRVRNEIWQPHTCSAISHGNEVMNAEPHAAATAAPVHRTHDFWHLTGAMLAQRGSCCRATLHTKQRRNRRHARV